MTDNSFVQGDCLELMSELPEHSIDAVICDLPYGITSQNPWDRVLPPDKLWTHYKRIVKPTGAIVLFAAMPYAAHLILENEKNFRYDLVWAKNKVTGFLNAKRMPLRQHENILVFYSRRGTYNVQKTGGHQPVHAFTKRTSDGPTYGATKLEVRGGGSTERYPTSMLQFPVVNNDSADRVHPSQKPLPLIEFLVKSYTNENDVVLDNCAGSGTTAIACLRNNRRFICMESEQQYVDIARQRIACQSS